jgi:uncharacterized RDD family membrane protein YckC
MLEVNDGSRLCPACGSRNPAANTYCNVCGANLVQPPTPAPAATSGTTCPNCGFVNEGPGSFCGECGARLPDPAAATGSGFGGGWSSSPPPPPPGYAPPPGVYPSPYSAPAMRQEISGYASFWRRLAALILDVLILLVPAFILALILFVLVDDLVANFLIWLAASTYFWVTNSYGGTLGKRILGIKVIDADGNQPGLSKGFVRAIIPSWIGIVNAASGGDATVFIGLISLLQLIDGLWMVWDSNKQTLHDKMAGTRVIKT